MALLLSRRKHRSLSNPSLFHLFSSSTTPTPDDQSTPEPSSNSPSRPSPFSSYFSEVRASLKQQNPNAPQGQNVRSTPKFQSLFKATNLNTSPPSKGVDLEEIRKNLSEFRRRSSDPSSLQTSTTSSLPDEQQQQPPQRRVSFQELYRQNAVAKQNTAGRVPSNKPGSTTVEFEAIKETLRQMKGNPKANTNANMSSGSMSGSRLKLDREIKGVHSTIIGGTERLPSAVFGEEMKEPAVSGEGGRTTEFLRMYTHQELGRKLRSLRPEEKGKGKGKEKEWFSLEELNERLKKLRELELKESRSQVAGVPFQDLRESLAKIHKSNAEETSKNSVQRLNLLGRLSAPDFMLQPSKEHLVEKYFHPDNMSSAEKMKIELSKVREEFKMSESDCGSARVQVALLTTKINHLQSALHKKDKHSQKGLKGMVDRRKKLLKYLRRTDWDSYCLVLSKFGLRDNPDHKNKTNPDYKNKNKKIMRRQ